MIATLRVVDSGLIVVDSVSGLEVGTEKLFPCKGIRNSQCNYDK